METNTVSLECGVIELGAITQRKKRDTRLHSCNTAISILGDQQQEEKQQLIRRVQSHHAGMKANLLGSSESFNYYGSAAMFGQDYSHLTAADALGDTQEKQQAEEETPNEQFHQVFVNFTSGLIAFLLSSTIAVSCASVVVGHGTPLSQYSSNFIDMNFLGSAVLSIVLAWKSYAPWTLGAIDVFVAPIMGQMAASIADSLDQDMEKTVPTVIIMVSLTSSLLGLVFMSMGMLRVTSIANYMPYPVIAGFLSGIGATLIKNGIHMASRRALSWEFFTFKQQALLLPAILFAAIGRLGQLLHCPVAISFPLLLILSLAIFHIVSYLVDLDMDTMRQQGWIFSWSKEVLDGTPMWYSWAKIDFSLVQWNVLLYDSFGFLVSLLLLGALKYSVAVTSLSTLFGREISPDHEMKVIGMANIVSGLLGCCGGCHYLSAMGILQQFGADEKAPAFICAIFFLFIWFQGFFILQYVPKFIFGGLILSVGIHFLETYFFKPFEFLKFFEKIIVLGITISFLCIGMLQSVGLGILISMLDLIYRIHEIGCVHHETTGVLSRSAVDRTREQSFFLDSNGNAIFILRLQGYLFFGTSVNLIERLETRIHSRDEFGKIQFVIVDFGLVPNVDATALFNLKKMVFLAEIFEFQLFFCGLQKKMKNIFVHTLNQIQKQNKQKTLSLSLRSLPSLPPSSSSSTSSFSSSSSLTWQKYVTFIDGNVEKTLEICENLLLPDELKNPKNAFCLPLKKKNSQQYNQLELWTHFLNMTCLEYMSGGMTCTSTEKSLMRKKANASATMASSSLSLSSSSVGLCIDEQEDADQEIIKKLLPLAAFLQVEQIPIGQKLYSLSSGLALDTYFICYGFIDVLTDSEFSSDRNIPGISMRDLNEKEDDNFIGDMRKNQRSISQWKPFTTARTRLRKIGPGSIITPDASGGLTSMLYYQHVATSDCILLRLSNQAMKKLEAQAPHTAVEILKLINSQLSSRFLHSNKRVSQLSSLLYK